MHSTSMTKLDCPITKLDCSTTVNDCSTATLDGSVLPDHHERTTDHSDWTHPQLANT